MQLARGESKTFTFTVVDSAGDPVDLTGAEITLVVTDLAGDTVLSLANAAAGGSADEIDVTDEDEGTFDVMVTAAQSDLEPTARWARCVVVTGADQTLVVAEREPFYVTGA
jgi:hypothetical protein